MNQRTVNFAAGGVLALSMVIGSCEPSCEPAPPAEPRVVEERQIGTSVEGRPIIAYRLGTPGGIPVMAIGSIHGDEQAGIEIVEYLRDAAAVPVGYDVWVVPSVNPDGNANGTRTNARAVDLNRNFSTNWQSIDCGAHPQNCSGPEPMSEPETQAVADFATSIQPRLAIVYHGADHVVSAAINVVASPNTVYAYADTAGYPLASVACSPSCTGTATQFINATIGGSSAFVVELSTKAAGGMSPRGVTNHVNAFFAAAANA